jgi:cytosine/adenosine deaminase-related metal-dependent hydrolase
MHLAEGTDDLAQQELALLDDLGCLGANTVLVHGVGVTERDQERIIAAGAAVIWCPASNMGMLGRTLMPRRLAAAGRLALGTDSRLTGSRDMLNELRVARRHSDLAPAELLRFATADAARILGLTGVGTLAAGACADLLILPDSGGDPYAALLSAHRSDIRAVVLGGIPVVADPDFAPWFEHCGLETTPATLDGRPKLIARNLLGPPGVSALEPGLVVHM